MKILPSQSPNFPMAQKIRSDMPAMLAVGAELRLPIIKINVGGNYFFDKSADYGHYVDLTPQNSTDYPVHIDNSEIIEQQRYVTPGRS